MLKEKPSGPFPEAWPKPGAGKEQPMKKLVLAAGLCALLALTGCGEDAKDALSDAGSQAGSAVSETISRVEEAGEDAKDQAEDALSQAPTPQPRDK